MRISFCYKQLIITLIYFSIQFYKTTQLNANERTAVFDDVISHTDYLITIYSSTARKPCFYFSENRFSQPESSIINCTWYKSNACCKRTEVASVFETMFTLNKASQSCMNMMNYMMCYFCSPDQYIWYRGTQVAICLKFCDELIEKCRGAEYKGKIMSEIYKDGTSFCQAQDFKVIKTNQQCFDFDSTPFSSMNRIKSNFVFSLLLLNRISSLIFT